MILDHSGRQRKPFLPRKEVFDLYVALIGRPARLMDGWRCRVNAQGHGEPYHTEGANLLDETRVMSVCSP